jgi:hypothetical protein
MRTHKQGQKAYPHALFGPLIAAMKTRGIILGIGLALVMLSGCGSNVVLDNPSDEGAVFTFDGADEYVLNPGERKEVSLSAGSHKVVVKRDKAGVVADTTFSLKEGGLVHSSASDYIVWRQLYGVQSDRKSLLNEDWVMVDSTRFFGDIKVYPRNVVFIEQNWTIGIDQAMPESQALYVTKDFQVESKIFAAPDFVKTYREMSEKNKQGK